jgi:hypothetical protein
MPASFCTFQAVASVSSRTFSRSASGSWPFQKLWWVGASEEGW